MSWSTTQPPIGEGVDLHFGNKGKDTESKGSGKGPPAHADAHASTLASSFCVVDMADHAPPNRRIADMVKSPESQEDLVKYRRDLSGARVRVLKNIMWCTTTTAEQKIMLTEERMENFAEENETLYQIELKLSNWPAQGTPEEGARLDEISSLWIKVVMAKALIYDLEGVITPTPSTPSTV